VNTQENLMTHEHYEPLFIPHDSVCIPAELYRQMRQAIDESEKAKRVCRNNLAWIAQFGGINDLGQHAIALWTNEE
jgi:hypothetical protein